MQSGAPAISLKSCTAKCGQGVQYASQAFFPGAFAFKAGFYVADRRRTGHAGQQLRHSAHLVWQRTGPRRHQTCPAPVETGFHVPNRPVAPALTALVAPDLIAGMLARRLAGFETRGVASEPGRFFLRPRVAH